MQPTARVVVCRICRDGFLITPEHPAPAHNPLTCHGCALSMADAQEDAMLRILLDTPAGTPAH